MEGNTLLRKHQYEYTENDIGRKIEQNKIKNQSQILKNIRGKNQIMKEGIELLDKMVVQLEQQIGIFRGNGNRRQCCKSVFFQSI